MTDARPHRSALILAGFALALALLSYFTLVVHDAAQRATSPQGTQATQATAPAQRALPATWAARSGGPALAPSSASRR